MRPINLKEILLGAPLELIEELLDSEEEFVENYIAERLKGIALEFEAHGQDADLARELHVIALFVGGVGS